jgi:hypothetical protein
MTTLDLSTYRNVESAIFVKIEIPGHTTIFMTDYKEAITIAGDTYTGIGQLLSITQTASELRMSNTEMTIAVSAIPITSISDFVAQPIKGSKVTVIRGIFNPVDHTLLSIGGNPTGKFKGIVNNYAISEMFDGRKESLTINFICKSQVGMVQSRSSGRRTNPTDEKLYFPADDSMNRVPSLANAKINFGGV